MTDVFVSYSRAIEAQAQRVAEMLAALGYDVWRDDQLPAHKAYTDVTEEHLRAAKAVLVLWTAEAVKSEWVRAEAEVARLGKTLVQMSLDGSTPPLPFNQIQCAEMSGWRGEESAPGWKKVLASIAALTGGVTAPAPAAAPRKLSICVLPFANISDDPQQEYFSDGISEDIITDLSKVSALAVVSRNSAFRYKGQHVDLPKVARELGVGHVLEGSVRKSGGRVRITAQLIDGATNDHVWAERYDRDLTDIFALQDEISEAIVKALKLKLLPAEKHAIEQRGTESVEAYELYLMARSVLLTGNDGDPRQDETIERLCRRAVEIDPGYAPAWVLMATAQSSLHHTYGRASDGGEAALGRALALDPDLAEAHAAKAVMLSDEGRHEEAAAEIAVALRLDPESYVVNRSAASISYNRGRVSEAVPYFEKAVALDDTALSPPFMLVSCYSALGDGENARRAARTALERAEKIAAADGSNGMAMGVGVTALAVLGEADRAKDWMRRALLFDPDNLLIRYNFACTLAAHLDDPEAALAMLEPILERDTGQYLVQNIAADPDLAGLRDDPRFQAMVGAAKARLAGGEAEPPA